MAPGNPVTAREPLDYRARMPFPAGDSPFDALVAELVADQLRANPVLASGLGVTEHDSELPDLSTDGIAARERAEDDWVRRLRAVDEGGLTDDELIDRDLALMVLRGRELQRDWADWRRTPDPYAGAALSGVFGLLQNRLRPDGELAEAVAARLLTRLLDLQSLRRPLHVVLTGGTVGIRALAAVAATSPAPATSAPAVGSPPN